MTENDGSSGGRMQRELFTRSVDGEDIGEASCLVS